MGVKDGDSLLVLPTGQKSSVEIRLEGIDAPERGQAFADEAKEALTRLCLGRTVRVEGKEIDIHGRLVARVRVGGRDLSYVLAAAGLAWHYERYSDDEALASAQRSARGARRGLWSLPDPVPPWEARARERQSRQAGERDGEERRELPYHGNRRSRVFHAPACRAYDCKNCTIELGSREEALRRGFRPCGICKP